MKKSEVLEITKGVEIIFKDKEYFNNQKEINKDPYGSACVEYAEVWMKLMQVEIGKGHTVIECAKETSNQADYMGITGFMYGCAVSIITACWEYGEQLRKWHNKEYDYEGSGVVNPALITVEVK
jgi:hypothetical protein